MLYPRTPLILIASAIAVLVVLAAIITTLAPSWPLWELCAAAGVAVLPVLLVDAVLVQRRRRQVVLTYHVPATWSVGRQQDLRLELRNHGARAVYCTVALDVPWQLVAEPASVDCELAARDRAEIVLSVRPSERGSYRLGGGHVALRSPLGCWQVHWREGGQRDIAVYPDVRQMADFDLLARTDRLRLIGIRKVRRVGGETEFERLREYQHGDPLRIVDWKSTARRHELIVRSFNVEQSQNVILVIDAGRMMMTRSGGDGSLRMIDQAINAALMLAHVAQRQGDRIGCVVYHRRLVRFVAPASGPRQVNRIVQALHDVEAEPCESRHDLAFLQLNARFRKRSLVIHLTNLLDEVNARELERQLRVIHGRHLALAVLLRDHDIYDALSDAPSDTESFYRAGAAAAIANWRQSAIERLSSHGILVLDCLPEQLTARLVSEYLLVKATNRL